MNKDVEESLDLLLRFASSVFVGPSWETPVQYRKPVTIKDVMDLGGKETWKDRMYRMLRPLSSTCKACSMCELGRKMNSNGHDPHVFSTMTPSKWMVVGQNPGASECERGKPFVGDAGDFFNKTVEKFGLQRSKFYISNAVKCYTERNDKPTAMHIQRCRPFLQMEMQLLRPVLVITLGAVGFDVFCPQQTMRDCLGKIVESDVFEDIKVYAIYHPSPRNMSVTERKKKFVEDVGRLCKLVKKYESGRSPYPKKSG